MMPIGFAQYAVGAYSQQCAKAQDRFIVQEINGALYAFVFDGHGQNPYPAQFLQRNLPGALAALNYNSPPIEVARQINQCIARLDAAFNSQFKTKAGSTINGVILRENELYVVNVGDSRCIAECKPRELLQVTADHSMSNAAEVRRVQAAGGEIQDGRYFPREITFWSFLMTRSFGNGFAKNSSGMIVDADVYYYALKERSGVNQQKAELSPASVFVQGQNEFNWVLVCTDGLLTLSNESIRSSIDQLVDSAAQKQQLDQANPFVICQRLVQQCVQQQTRFSYADDISCVLLLNEQFVARNCQLSTLSFHRPRTLAFDNAQVDLRACVQKFLLDLTENYQKYKQINKLKDIMAGKAQGDMHQYFCCLCQPQLDYAKLCKAFLSCERLTIAGNGQPPRTPAGRKRSYGGAANQ